MNFSGHAHHSRTHEKVSRTHGQNFRRSRPFWSEKNKQTFGPNSRFLTSMNRSEAGILGFLLLLLLPPSNDGRAWHQSLSCGKMASALFLQGERSSTYEMQHLFHGQIWLVPLSIAPELMMKQAFLFVCFVKINQSSEGGEKTSNIQVSKNPLLLILCWAHCMPPDTQLWLLLCAPFVWMTHLKSNSAATTSVKGPNCFVRATSYLGFSQKRVWTWPGRSTTCSSKHLKSGRARRTCC